MDYKRLYYKYKMKYLTLKEASLEFKSKLTDENLEKCIPEEFDIKVIDDFLTTEECIEIINLAKPILIRSQVLDDENPISNYRTSSGVFVNSSNHPILKKISEKVSEITGIPTDNQEDIQIINYQPGQYYKKHYDACLNDSKECQNDKELGIRKNTFFVYLNNVKEGGYTAFPNLLRKIVPKAGRAVYWNNVLVNSESFVHDPCSLHLGVKPDEGEKWALTVWSRIKKN